jgi:hypothetical protein
MLATKHTEILQKLLFTDSGIRQPTFFYSNSFRYVNKDALQQQARKTLVNIKDNLGIIENHNKNCSINFTKLSLDYETNF